MGIFDTDDGTAARIDLHDLVDFEEFHSNYRSRQLSPSKRLLLAVLDNAIDFLRKKNKKDPETKKPRRKESLAWIMSDDDFFFSFNNVCEILDINPAYLRRALVARYPALLNGSATAKAKGNGKENIEVHQAKTFSASAAPSDLESGPTGYTIRLYGQTLPAAYDPRHSLKVYPAEFLQTVLIAWRKRRAKKSMQSMQWTEIEARKKKPKKLLPKVRCRHAGTNAWFGHWKGKYDRYRSCERCRQIYDHPPNEGEKPVKPERQVSLSGA